MKRRKSCPVFQRDFMNLESFNKEDKSTYDGTETVRGLNKFDRNWFRENSIAIVYTSKSFSGRTFVVPYVDIDGKRYWLVDKIKQEKNKEKLRNALLAI